MWIFTLHMLYFLVAYRRANSSCKFLAHASLAVKVVNAQHWLQAPSTQPLTPSPHPPTQGPVPPTSLGPLKRELDISVSISIGMASAASQPMTPLLAVISEACSFHARTLWICACGWACVSVYLVSCNLYGVFWCRHEPCRVPGLSGVK